ncbi:MAG: DUF2834 domain-containing protein [Acidobacteria bacterium]|nr:DUF2834 domain-containing protein [Acidobacteriota bacterium]
MKSLLLLCLFAFLAFTATVLYQHGYRGFFHWAFYNSATGLLFFDLVITLTLVSAWIMADARERGVLAVPYLLLTAAFGAAGPLLYLLRRRRYREAVNGKI